MTSYDALFIIETTYIVSTLFDPNFIFFQSLFCSRPILLCATNSRGNAIYAGHSLCIYVHLDILYNFLKVESNFTKIRLL